MVKKKVKEQKQLSVLESTPILTPINIDSIGSTNNDPCFGKHYDLTTDECKLCGDSELCCIKFANSLGKTRKSLEEKNKYKDLEILVDKVAVRKTIRYLIRKGDEKSTIIQKLQAKYELSQKEARMLYREYIKSKTK